MLLIASIRKYPGWRNWYAFYKSLNYQNRSQNTYVIPFEKDRHMDWELDRIIFNNSYLLYSVSYTCKVKNIYTRLNIQIKRDESKYFISTFLI